MGMVGRRTGDSRSLYAGTIFEVGRGGVTSFYIISEKEIGFGMLYPRTMLFLRLTPVTTSTLQ